MPRHVRKGTLESLQTAMDRMWEFSELERLDPEEKHDVFLWREKVESVFKDMRNASEMLEERGDFQPQKISGPVSTFSWAMHDAKAIAKRPKRKSLSKEQLEKKLAKLTAMLKELQDESQ